MLDPRAQIRTLSIYDDLATLLVDLHLKPVPMLTGGRLVQKFFERCRQAVVEGHFGPGEYQPALLDFYCAYKSLFRWSMVERDLARRPKMRLVAPLAKPVLAHYMRGVTARHLR